MESIPLLKYVDSNGSLSFWSISRATTWNDRLCIASTKSCISWLISWNRDRILPTVSLCLCIPRTLYTYIRAALEDFSKKRRASHGLKKHVKMDVVTLFSYGSAVVKSLNDRRPFIVFAHFLYHSSKKGYISAGWSLDEQCRVMPVVDNYGNVTKTRKKILFRKQMGWVDGKKPHSRAEIVLLRCGFISARIA